MRTLAKYISTSRNYKKVNNVIRRNVISYCIDDPYPPHKGVKGKGKVESLTTSAGISLNQKIKISI
jgi:hypothetical protein